MSKRKDGQRWHAAQRQVKIPHNGWPMESGKQGQGHTVPQL